VHGLFRDARGRWCVDLRWCEPRTGEWRRYRERLPAGLPAVAAKARTREILAAALAGGFDPKREKPRTLSEGFAAYGAWCDANRPAAAKRRAAVCARLLAGLGDLRLDLVSAFHVERFKRDRLKEGRLPRGRPDAEGNKPVTTKGDVAAGTVNRDLEVLSHFFALAQSWGWVTAEQVRVLRAVSHLKEPPGRVRYLVGDEEARLLAALSPGIRPIVVTALLSGMRQAEVVNLTKDAVDLGAGMLTLTTTKANRVRRIYINAALAVVLRGTMARSPGPYVFTNTAGEPYTCDGVRTLFRRAVAKAEIEDFHFHDLRHTTATRLRQAGAGIDVVADVLGHTTLTMARRYAHLGADTMRAAMDRLQAIAAVG